MRKIIELVSVDKSNWLECSNLRLNPEQEGNLASNLKTIAEASFEDHYILRAIRENGRTVGMLAYCPEVDEPVKGLFWLFRIMVDKRFQGHGIGKKAVELSLEEMRTLGATTVRTMCRRDNETAQELYKSLNFQEVGILDDGDILFEYKIICQPVAGGDAAR